MANSASDYKRRRESKLSALQLSKLSKMGQNQFCADCGDKPAKWVSVNIGCWLCMRCSGIHRGLGVDVSYVKSTTLDDWNYEMVNKFKALGGNKGVNDLYEGRLSEQQRKKTKITRFSDEYVAIDFITNKYVRQKWMTEHSPTPSSPSSSSSVQTPLVSQSPSPSPVPPPSLKKSINHHLEEKVDFQATWIQFEEQPVWDKTLSIDMTLDQSDHGVPDLMNAQQLRVFAQSDLCTAPTPKKDGFVSLFDALDIKQEESPKSSKSIIMSKYNIDDESKQHSQSESQSSSPPKFRRCNVSYNMPQNPYIAANCNYLDPLLSDAYNAYHAVNIDNKQSQRGQDTVSVLSNLEFMKQATVSNKASINELDEELEWMEFGRSVSLSNLRRPSIVNIESKANNPFKSEVVDPFDHINNLVNNNQTYFMYNQANKISL